MEWFYGNDDAIGGNNGRWRRRKPCHENGELILERKLVAPAVRRAGDGEVNRAGGFRRQHARRVADGLVIEPVADPDTETLRQITDFLVGFVFQRDMKNKRVLGVEAEHLLDADFVVVEIGNLRLVAKGFGLGIGDCISVLFFQQRKRLGLVEQRKQLRRCHEGCGQNSFSRGRIIEIECQNRRVAFRQLKDEGLFVPADVEICRGLARERADGQKRRAFRMRELELPRRLSIGGHAHGINRGDWAGKADGRDSVRRNGNGDDDVFIERDVLDGFGWFSQSDGSGQEEDANL